LTASNEYGSTTATATVDVSPAGSEGGLVARLATDPVGQARVGQAVTLDATDSTFGDAGIRTYEFQSGDGRVQEQGWGGGEWIVAYFEEGGYQPCVRVQNSDLAWSAWTCETLNVVDEVASGPDLRILRHEIDGSFVDDPQFWTIEHGGSLDLTVHWYNDGADLALGHPDFDLEVFANGEKIAGRDYEDMTWQGAGDGRTFSNIGDELEPGVYDVLMMIDSRSVIEEINESNNTHRFELEVDSLPPTADFSVTPQCLTTTFTDGSTHPMGDSNIARWTWDFDDGSTSSAENPVHTFDAPGDYRVELTVEDRWGNTDDRRRTVSVVECIDPPTIGAFQAIPNDIFAGDATTLTWNVAGADPVTLTIDHSVGDVSSESSVQVSPPATTTYTLTASNTAGSASATTTVNVSEVVSEPEPNVSTALVEPVGTDCDGAMVGESCDVTVALTGNDGTYAAVQFVVLSDAFSVQGVTTSTLAQGCLAEAGPDLVAVVCSAPFVGDGELADVQLQREVAGDATIDVFDVWLIDPDSVRYATQGGSIQTGSQPATCPIAAYAERPLGDFDENGSVGTADALLILRAAVGATPAPPGGSAAAYHGDLNGDGVVGTPDALLALRKAVDPTLAARIAAWPPSLELSVGGDACVLIGNAGRAAMPSVTAATPAGIEVEDITPSGSTARVMRVSRASDGSGTITFDAGSAGSVTVEVTPTP
jgi:PKD repeat protein